MLLTQSSLEGQNLCLDAEQVRGDGNVTTLGAPPNLVAENSSSSRPSNHAVVDIVVPLLFGLSAIEQRVRRQRQNAGIGRAKTEGKYRGRKPGSTVAKPSRSKTLKARGLTLNEIADTLKVSKATVCRHLKSAWLPTICATWMSLVLMVRSILRFPDTLVPCGWPVPGSGVPAG